jgi:hypothetical protein
MFTFLVVWHTIGVILPHRHLTNIDCLTAHTACLVCFITTVNGYSKKIIIKGEKCGASSRHITNLKQSIFSFNIYGLPPCVVLLGQLACPLNDVIFVYLWNNQPISLQTLQTASSKRISGVGGNQPI